MEQSQQGQAPIAPNGGPTHANVYVKGLPQDASEEWLLSVFQQFGQIQSLRIFRSAQKAGFGFVRLATVEEAQAAVQALDGQQLGDTVLEVKFADSDAGAATADRTPPPSDNLYVKNLPPTYGEEELRQLFGAFGAVTMCRVLHQGDQTAQGGAALVRMSSVDEAAAAMQRLSGQRVLGALSPLVVRFSDTAEIKARKQAKQASTAQHSAGGGGGGSGGYQRYGGGAHVIPGPGGGPHGAAGRGGAGAHHVGYLAAAPAGPHQHQPPVPTAIMGLADGAAPQPPHRLYVEDSAHGYPMQGAHHHTGGPPSGGRLSANGPGLVMAVSGANGAPVGYAAGAGGGGAMISGYGVGAYGVGAINANGGLGGTVPGMLGAGGGSASLYIKNLPLDGDKLLLYEKFAPFGAILSVKLLTDESGASKGVGFVNFADHVSASKAVAALHNLPLGERHLHVAFQTHRAK